MNILWIGMAVPESLAATLSASDKYITGQTQAFQTRIIRALEHGDRNQVCIISSPPVTDWSKVRFTRRTHWRHSNSPGPNVVVPIANFIGLKQLSVFLGCFLAACARALKHDTRRTMIVVGDSYFPHLLAAWLAARVTGIKVAAFITDVPGLLAVADPWYKRLVRPIDVALVMGLLRRMNGLIVLSPHIAGDFFPGMPHLVMQGIVEPAQLQPAHEAAYRTNNDFIIMYSGALMPEYGLELLIEAFRKFEGPAHQLWITGKGDYEPQVRSAARQDGRIKFLGFVGHDELRLRLQQADVLISLRISHAGHARYSFPSKLLEYMTQGSFVISNRFPSLPDSYARHLLILQEETAEELAALFARIKRGAYGDAKAFALGMRNFILSEATAEAQGRRLGSYLENLPDRRTR